MPWASSMTAAGEPASAIRIILIPNNPSLGYSAQPGPLVRTLHPLKEVDVGRHSPTRRGSQVNKTKATGAGLMAFGVLVTIVNPGHWVALAAAAVGLFLCIAEIQREIHAEKIARFRQSGLPDSLFGQWEERYRQMKSGRLPESFLRDWELQFTGRHQD